MRLRSSLAFLLAAICLSAFTGCNTFERRSKEKAAVFATLDAATRTRLQAGEIHIGDTTDEVYIALGRPDEQRDRATGEGQTSLWIYNRYWQEYQGDVFVGSRPVYVKNPTTGAVTVFYEPVRRPIYVGRSEARLRLTFQNGRVTVIERPLTRG